MAPVLTFAGHVLPARHVKFSRYFYGINVINPCAGTGTNQTSKADKVVAGKPDGASK